MTERIFASDGLIARANRDYAEDKLSFLERFGPPALNMTARKPRRFYIDLFAGPGLNIDSTSGREFEGAALRVTRMVAPGQAQRTFTDAILINLDEAEHCALGTRVTRLGSTLRGPRVLARQADANVLGPTVMRSLAANHPAAYALVFADPENPKQLPWATVEAIGTCGLASTDLYVLVPLDMGLNRMIAYDPAKTAASAASLTAYFGNEGWRDIVARNAQNSATRRDLRAALLDLYMNGLRRHWNCVVAVRDVHRGRNQRLYRMVFCTRNPAALTLLDWERTTRAPHGQFALGLDVA